MDAALNLLQSTVSIDDAYQFRVTASQIQVAADASQDEALRAAREESNVARHLEGKTVQKEIFVPGRLVNFVAK